MTSQAAKASGFTLQEETRMSAETGVSDTRGDEIDELKQKNNDLVVVEACFHEANKRKQKGWK